MKKLIIYCLSFVLLATSVVFNGCRKEEEEEEEGIDPVYNGLSSDIQNIIPADILNKIIDLGMPIHRGDNPPNFENTYFITPLILIQTTVPNDYDLGTQFLDMEVTFYEQNNNNLTVKIDYIQGTQTGIGRGGFIAGEDNKFTVFAAIDVEISGYHADMIEIYSAKVVSGGLNDFYLANFMIDNYGDPGGVGFIPNGTGRILYDSDGFSEIMTSETSTFTDSRDGQTYNTIKIGNQLWMAENLNYYTSSGSWCYDNNSSNCSTYGRLYDWETALTVAPASWHLPTDAEWTTLINSLGGESVAGGKMKETGTSHWNSPNTGATNESGFTALPGGRRSSDGSFHYLGSNAHFWSATEHDASYAWSRYLYCNSADVTRNYHDKSRGFCVRCVKD